MYTFQALVSLLLTSTDAFTGPRVDTKRVRVFRHPRHVDSVIISPRSRNQITLQGFKIDHPSTTPTKQKLPSASSSKQECQNSVTTSEPVPADEDNSYVRFAKDYPFMNNFIIASLKTCAADILAQTVIAHNSLGELDLQRSLLFCTFGGLYSGAFQYMYQVQVFKKLFDVDKFTSQSWREKLKDVPGVKALAAQTGLDLTVLTLVYLPAFYIFKASVFSGSTDPSEWFSTGLDTYATNFGKDEADLLKVWLPADLICFSVPLYLRMPVRQSVSFLWTAYLSFSRGGH